MAEYLNETVFTWGGVPLKFGAGAVDEIGHDLRQQHARRVLLVTDAGVWHTGAPQRVADAARAEGLSVEIYDQAHVEPTDASIAHAVEFANQAQWDGFVAVGGGSSIDTAKAINLLTSYPGAIDDYLNQPIGAGQAPPGPLKPLVAVPTTAGTGAESTPVCVLDLLGRQVKTGISHPTLRPTLAVVDPLLTLSLPASVTAAAGMDVLCHALESYTAKPYHAFARHSASTRVAYCGSNPISDLWAENAIRLVGRSLRTAVLSGGDLAARTDMLLAATFAGMGFGNAGVHIPHACGYPLAGMIRDYVPAGYPHEPLLPHGQSVSLTAPETFRFTFPTDPSRHVRAAELLEPAAQHAQQRERLPSALTGLMRDIGIPNGIGEVGYADADIDQLVAGAMQQRRLLDTAPRQVTVEHMTAIFRHSTTNW